MPSATSSSSAAPCIVLGLETQIGLAIVRELGRAGIPVIGIAQSSRALGLRSRHLTHGIIVDRPRSSELLGTIRRLGEQHGPCALVTVSEANLLWLNQHRAELGQVRAALPAADRLAWVLDKQRTLALAREVGIAVPETAEPTSLAEAEALASRFRFPAVLKWKDPNAISAALRAHGLALQKAEYVYTAQEWLEIARRYAPLQAWPMVQEYCPGRGLGQFFFMHDGQAVRRFQHVRVAEWPPEGGFSSVCDAVPLSRHAELQQRSIELLRRIGWQGVAMVEYRWDEATDRAVLMEINGRFWGSFPLAAHCGAGFGVLAYAQALGLPLPVLPEPRDDLRCRMVATELKRLVRLWLHPGRIADRSYRVRRGAELWRFVADFFRPRVCYFVARRDDMAPFWADLRNAVRPSSTDG
jgi:predicted ATP-grasp superfamily ATP-dependent carboligase